MKTLNNYIKESLLDDEEDLIEDETTVIDNFFKTVCVIKPRYGQKNPSYKYHDGIVDVDGSVEYIDNSITSLTGGLFKYGTVDGWFDCTGTNIKDLKGAPRLVTDDFYCNRCKKLTTLEGAPENLADGEFICSDTDIRDLKGAPKKMKIFNCNRCKKLVTLKGLEKSYIDAAIMMSKCENLKSLEYLPQSDKSNPYSLACRECNSLKNLKGCPDRVYSFACNKSNNLESLEGAPKEVLSYFRCSDCGKLESLEEGPKTVMGEYDYHNTPAADDKKNYEIAEATKSNHIIK